MDELPTQLDLDDALTLKESCSALLFSSPPPSPICSIPSTPFQAATQIDLVSPSVLDISTAGTQLDERPIDSQTGPDSCAGTQLDNEEFVYVDNDEDDHILTNKKGKNVNESLDASLFDHSTQGDDSPCPSPFQATQLDRTSPMPSRRRPSTPTSPSSIGTQLDNPSPLGRMSSPYSAPHSPSDFGGSATQLDVPMALGLAATQDDSLIIKPTTERKKKASPGRRLAEAGTIDDSFDNTFMSATQGDNPIVDGSDSLGSEATQMDEVPTVIDGEGEVIPLLSGRRQTKAKNGAKIDDRYDEDLPTQMDDEMLPSATSNLLLPFEKGEMYDPTPPFDEYSSFKFSPLPKSNLKERQQEKNNKRKRREDKAGTAKAKLTLNESGGTDQEEEASTINKKKRRKEEPSTTESREKTKQNNKETVTKKKEANDVSEKGDKGNESPLKESKKKGSAKTTNKGSQKKKLNEEEDEPKTVPLKEEEDKKPKEEEKKRESIPGALAILVSLNKKFIDVPVVEKKDVVMGRHKSCTEGCKFSSAHISTRHCRFFVEMGVEGPAIPMKKESEKGEESMSPKLHEEEEKQKEEEEKKSINKEEEDEEGSDDNSDTIPLCMYGDKCYRKNPQHFKQFRHPHLEKKGSKENQKSKKRKEEEAEEEKKKQEQETKTKEAEDKEMKKKVCNYRVLLEDLSTNGTFVNEKLVGKGNKVVLQHGDEVSLVAPSSQLPNISIDIAMYRIEYTP